MRGRWSHPIFGPFRRRAHTGVPADHFPKAKLLYGDNRTVLIADGPAAVLELPTHPILRALGTAFMLTNTGLRRAVTSPDIDDSMHVCDRPDELAADQSWTCDVCDTTFPPVAELLPPPPEPANHAKMTGPHSHQHSHSDGTTHSHGHFHNDANVHNHSHGAAIAIQVHALSESQRRRRDPANEITDEAELAALVASTFERAGGRDAWTALRDRKGLTAATAADGTVTPAPWHAYLCAEGIRTDDGREFVPGALRWNDLPLSLRLLVEDEGGHWGAVTCGRVDTIADDRVMMGDVGLIYGEGVFGSDENGQLAELLVEEQTQRFVSIDPRDGLGEVIEIETIVNGEEIVRDCWVRYSDCLIGAATIVALPALQQAVITLRDVPLPDISKAIDAAPPSLGDMLNDDAAMVASAAAPAGGPPTEYFANPQFGNGSTSDVDNGGDPRLVRQKNGAYACPSTVGEPDENGWRPTWGHAAYWSAEHTGFPNGDPLTGEPVHPPRSMSGYAYFNTGQCPCDDPDCAHAVGQITMGCGHAPMSKQAHGRRVQLAAHEVKAHYDGGYGAVQVADVTCGEDAYGIWYAGAIRPDVTDKQLREFMTMGVSGDWRDMAGSLDLLAVLSVPAPGFPIARRQLALAASGEAIDDGTTRVGMQGDRIYALVAAGVVQRVSDAERIAVLEQQVAELTELLRPMAVQSVRDQFGL